MFLTHSEDKQQFLLTDSLFLVGAVILQFGVPCYALTESELMAPDSQTLPCRVSGVSSLKPEETPIRNKDVALQIQQERDVD